MLVGGIGPCLEDIGDDTGLDAKGQSILILTNRLAKLYGLFAWTGVDRPHTWKLGSFLFTKSDEGKTNQR